MSIGIGACRLGLLSVSPCSGLISYASGPSWLRKRTDGCRILPERWTAVCSSSNEAHVVNSSSRSAQAVAVVASVVVASIGCLVFAAGSSNGSSSSSWRATPSRVGPLCWLGVLGFATDLSYLNESSIWEYVFVSWGTLERQSGTRFALPACHRKSISYACRLRAHLLCSFGSRLRL